MYVKRSVPYYADNKHNCFKPSVLALLLIDEYWNQNSCVGATLFDARQLFDQQDMKADELLREIVRERKLPDAVEACTVAAAVEFDLPRQKALLKVATPPSKSGYNTFRLEISRLSILQLLKF